MDKVAIKDTLADLFQAAEAIRTLRTNLLLCGESVRSVGITSYASGAGKTSLALQLAASLAQGQKSVLLIDADLRERALQTRLDIREKVDGLSQYLLGRSPIEQVVKQTDVAGLFVLFAGSGVADPSGLLGGERFRELISKLKDAVDYIIVDTAALGQVIDCAAMAPALDGVVVVVDASHNSCRQQRCIISQIERAGGQVLGVVLNRVADLRRERMLRPIERLWPSAGPNEGKYEESKESADDGLQNVAGLFR